MEPISFTVTIVRHGETDKNKSNSVQTFSDDPLNETGLNQANAVGNSLSDIKFKAAYASDQIRAMKTAECIIKNSKHEQPEIILDRKIRERRFGEDIEGTCGKSWIERAYAWAMKEKCSPLHFKPPGSESYEETKDRAFEFIKEICNKASHGDHILVVSHGLLIMTLLDYLKNEKALFEVKLSIPEGPKGLAAPIKNCSVSKIRIDTHGDDPKRIQEIDIIQYNDHSHIN